MPNNPLSKDISYDSRTADKFVVRLTQGLRSQILQAAKKHHRSMNSEIVARIDGSLELEEKYEEMRQFSQFLLRRIKVLESTQSPDQI